MKHAIAATLLLACGAGGAMAAATDGSFGVDGPGNQSCAAFVEALDKQDKTATVAFAAWSEGFITSVNVFRDDTFDITPWQSTALLMGKMQNFCRQNPDMPYVNALGRLIGTLMPQRQTGPSEIVQLRSGDKAVALPRMMVDRVKSAIEAANGAPIPTPEGQFDDAFATAIKTYQTAQKLVPTGLPDQPTLNALFP